MQCIEYHLNRQNETILKYFDLNTRPACRKPKLHLHYKIAAI